MIRLYLCEDAQDSDVVVALRQRGIDVLTADEADMRPRADADHLAYATAQNRALYSFNIRDYNILHAASLAEGKSHTGIILAPQQRYGVGEQMRRLLRLIHTISAEEMRNRLEFLSTWG
ncbi:MAG: DUF5615 family PIN-like protein [Rubrivivax sp.]|nr:DUF5615 family PIN-like protein [Pyrinomonadaceae bacterium]